MSAAMPTFTTLLGDGRVQIRGSTHGRVQIRGSNMAAPISRTQSVRNPLERLAISGHPQLRRPKNVVCYAASNARCAAEQTATVTRQSSTITIAPIQGKEKSPDLDDGGSGFPPRDDDDGGGGGGGGGGNWSGGFFFFGFLAFLGFLKDKESEGPYKDDRRRY